jgi:1-phosphofructokinase family hexose kinase
MIVTLTPNTTIDYNIFIPSFRNFSTMRAVSSKQSTGGKPVDASMILGEMGIPSLALGIAGGETGKLVEKLLHSKGATVDFIWADQDTRRNVVIVAEDGSADFTITTTSMDITPGQVADLRARYIAALDEASCVVMGGTLPRGMEPEFYTDAISQARARDIPVIFDASEPFLSGGLAGRPSYAKPNRDELSALIGKPVKTIQDAYQAGRDIIAKYGTCPIISLGSEGGLAVLPQTAYRIPPLHVDVVSAAGAGDGVLAGLAASVHQGGSIEDGLRLAFACATAVLLQPGTAECNREDIDRFRQQVELIPYP